MYEKGVLYFTQVDMDLSLEEEEDAESVQARLFELIKDMNDVPFVGKLLTLRVVFAQRETTVAIVDSVKENGYFCRESNSFKNVILVNKAKLLGEKNLF